MTGIERYWLDEDIACVRTYLNIGPEVVSDKVIEYYIQSGRIGAKGIACEIMRKMRDD